MQKQYKTACIFGGTGFVGRYVTQELARRGYRIKIATRMPESAYDVKLFGNVGQIVAYQCNYNDAESIMQAVSGCDVVINLVGILFEKGKNKFKRLHTDLPETIAKACEKQSVDKFIHVSALGVEQSKSRYAASKKAGEDLVLKAFPRATILRPSVVFGAGDSFFKMFARLSTLLPALPLIGGGQTKFQPVYVGDIADAVGRIADNKDGAYEGEIYALGGLEVLSFKEVYERIFRETGRSTMLIPVPWFVAKIQGIVFGLMPKPLLTLDQVRSLRTDNVVPENAKGLSDLGLEPTPIDSILFDYLSCYKKGGRFADKKTA